MYIAIEGLKGTGKSTLVDNLQSWLQAKGIDYDLLCPTRPMPEDHWLEQKAKLPQFTHHDEFHELLYTARSHYHAQRADFNKSLVLGDRSIFTSLATRWHRTETVGMANYVADVRSKERHLHLPEHVIMLRLPIEMLMQRLQARDTRNYGRQDECMARLLETEQAYAALETHANMLGYGHVQWHHIESNQPLDGLVECIGSKIISHLELNA